jgi:hypothetical protein
MKGIGAMTLDMSQQPVDQASSLRWDDLPAEPWEGNGPCEDCGGRNFPWSAPHELWECVMG